MVVHTIKRTACHIEFNRFCPCPEVDLGLILMWIIIEATVALMMMMKPRQRPGGDKGRRSLWWGASADLLKHHSSSMALPRNLKNNEKFSDAMQYWC